MGLVFCLKFVNREGGIGAPIPHRHALCQLPRKPGIFFAENGMCPIRPFYSTKRTEDCGTQVTKEAAEWLLEGGIRRKRGGPNA